MDTRGQIQKGFLRLALRLPEIYYTNDPVLILVSVICETFKIKPPSALETKIYD